jgi:hypothetical protein
MVALGRGASVGGLILFGTTTSLFAKIGESPGVAQGFAAITSSAVFEHGAPRLGPSSSASWYIIALLSRNVALTPGRPFLAGTSRPPSRRPRRAASVCAPAAAATAFPSPPGPHRSPYHHDQRTLMPTVYELESVGLDGKQKLFQKPWAMTLTMFVGESTFIGAAVPLSRCHQLHATCFWMLQQLAVTKGTSHRSQQLQRTHTAPSEPTPITNPKPNPQPTTNHLDPPSQA